MSNRRRQERAERKAQGKRKRGWITGLAIVAFVAMLAFMTWQQIGGAQVIPANEVSDPSLGSPGAAVEIVEYADFGCPACQAWHRSGVREQILADYGDRVRFVWRDFPVITAQSPKAAEAGHCAAQQDGFWEFHDYLYEQGAGLSIAALQSYAGAVGLDQQRFDACLSEGVMARKVESNLQEARRLGLRGTPGFTLNGSVLAAPPSYSLLSELIENELNAN